MPKAGSALVALAKSHGDMTLRQVGLVAMVTLGAETGIRYSIGGVATVFGISKSSVVRIVDRLALLGFVGRTGDPADRRGVFVVPTERGKKFMASVEAA